MRAGTAIEPRVAYAVADLIARTGPTTIAPTAIGRAASASGKPITVNGFLNGMKLQSNGLSLPVAGDVLKGADIGPVALTGRLNVLIGRGGPESVVLATSQIHRFPVPPSALPPA